MNLQKIQEKKKGISPIIATLLLILIAIAAGVIVYAYVIGFIGNSTTNTGNNTSIISIDNACVSAAGTHCSSDAFTVTFRNVGSTTISGTGVVYLNDVTQGITLTSTETCAPSNIGPGSTYTCTGTTSWTGTGPNAGDIVSLKIVMPDGGAATTSVKAVA